MQFDKSPRYGFLQLPPRPLEHFQVERVPYQAAVNVGERMARGHGAEEVGLIPEAVGMVEGVAKLDAGLLPRHRNDAPHVQAFLRQCSRFIEADETQLPTKVYPGWRRAEDGGSFQPRLRVHGAHGHGGGERGRHHDRQNVQDSQEGDAPGCLR